MFSAPLGFAAPELIAESNGWRLFRKPDWMLPGVAKTYYSATVTDSDGNEDTRYVLSGAQLEDGTNVLLGYGGAQVLADVNVDGFEGSVAFYNGEESALVVNSRYDDPEEPDGFELYADKSWTHVSPAPLRSWERQVGGTHFSKTYDTDFTTTDGGNDPIAPHQDTSYRYYSAELVWNRDGTHAFYQSTDELDRFNVDRQTTPPPEATIYCDWGTLTEKRIRTVVVEVKYAGTTTHRTETVTTYIYEYYCDTTWWWGDPTPVEGIPFKSTEVSETGVAHVHISQALGFVYVRDGDSSTVDLMKFSNGGFSSTGISFPFAPQSVEHPALRTVLNTVVTVDVCGFFVAPDINDVITVIGQFDNEIADITPLFTEAGVVVDEDEFSAIALRALASEAQAISWANPIPGLPYPADGVYFSGAPIPLTSYDVATFEQSD